MREEQIRHCAPLPLPPQHCCHTVSFFSHLTPSSCLPPDLPHPLSSVSWLHFASATTEQAAIARTEGETFIASSLLHLSLLSCSTAMHPPPSFFSFLMICLSFIHRGSSQEIGKENLFFSRDLISECCSHSILPLPSSLLGLIFVCCRKRAYSSLWQ